MFPSAAASLSLSLQRRTAPVVSHNAPVRGGRRTYRSQCSASAIASPIRTSIARLLMRCAIKLGTWAETAALWLAPWLAGVRND